MKHILTGLICSTAILSNLPAYSMTNANTKVWVVKDNGSGHQAYLKPYSQLKMETKTIQWMIKTNQKIDTEHLGGYYLGRLVIKNGDITKVMFMNNYGDMRIYRLHQGKQIGECVILLSANDGIGWCDE